MNICILHLAGVVSDFFRRKACAPNLLMAPIVGDLLLRICAGPGFKRCQPRLLISQASIW